MKVYKIRNQEGLFSTGGTRPSFTKTGKTWGSIGHVKSHLRQLMGDEIYGDAELVTIRLTKENLNTKSVLDIMQEMLHNDKPYTGYQKEKHEYLKAKIKTLKESYETIKANK